MKVLVCIPSVVINAFIFNFYLISKANLHDLTTGTRGYYPRVAGTRRLKKVRIRVWLLDIVTGTRYPRVVPVKGLTQDPDDPLMALSLLPNNFALDSIDGLDSFGDPQFLNIDLSSTSNNNQRASISSTLTPKGSKSPPTNQSSDLVPVKRAAYTHPLIRKALQNMDGSVPKPPKAPPTSPIAPEDMALLKFQRKPKVFSFNINLLLILERLRFGAVRKMPLR